jgi:pimeloyl-ACP methyl ester carboxylesterase
MRTGRAAIAAVALAAAGVGAHGTQEPAAAKPAAPSLRPRVRGKVVLEPCRLPGLAEEALCGSYEVFENRAARQGRKIRLQLAILPARSAHPAPAPLLYMAGGPGQSARAAAGMVAETFAGLRDEREILLLDQRGTGGSNPLECALYGAAEDPQSYLGDMLPLDSVRACLAKLDADPRLYTTPVAADDLDEVRAALGYDRVDMYAISYGTRAALVYMRQHPQHVRSVILQAVVPTHMKVPFYYARDAQRALDLLFAECAADAACNRAYPDLPRKFAAVEERLRQGPVAVEIHDPAQQGKAVRFMLSLDNYNEGVRWRLYDEGSSRVPAYIQQAYDGDYTLVAQEIWRLRRMAAHGNLLSVGDFLTITCTEDVAFIDPGEAKRAAAGSFLGTYRVDQQKKACAAWPRGELPPGYTDDVRSAVPALILSGYRDPVTPPSWGEQVAKHLPNSRHLALREGFHGDPDPCVVGIMDRFIVQGTAKGLDTSCTEKAHRQTFYVPAARPGR